MKKQGFAFEFELPDDWIDDSGDGRQVVAHGSHDEELIVSGSVVSGPDSPGSFAAVRDAVLKNAFRATEGAADVPELKITQALNKEEDAAAGLQCWTLQAQTTDGEVLFLQAVIASDIAVMIATIEGPNQKSTLDAFRTFLKGVRPAVVH
jgi:hypothetical protein